VGLDDTQEIPVVTPQEQIGTWIVFLAPAWHQPHHVRLAQDIIDDLEKGDDITWNALLRYLHEKTPTP